MSLFSLICLAVTLACSGIMFANSRVMKGLGNHTASMVMLGMSILLAVGGVGIALINTSPASP